MTLDHLIALRDDLSAAIAYESQNHFLLNELVRVSEANARLMNALHQANADMRGVLLQLADQELELRRLRVALEASKRPPRRKIRPLKRRTNRLAKAL